MRDSRNRDARNHGYQKRHDGSDPRVAIGLVLGLAGATGAARLIRTLLFNVQPLDPLIYGGVAVLFAAVATLACLIPSLRAARIDPLAALRTE